MGGVFAIAVLVAAVRAAQTGSLFERLFTPKEAQCAEASTSPENAALASVRLTVEGMVCYG